MDATSLPQQCLQLIFEGMELEELVAVGGVCSAWRAASLATRYDLSLPWTYLQAFSDLVREKCVTVCGAPMIEAQTLGLASRPSPPFLRDTQPLHKNPFCGDKSGLRGCGIP